MDQPLDVAIIGAGTAGLAALREVRQRTERFVIVNDGPWGTVCARVGCMPSKTLIEAANAYHRRLRFAELGISGAEALAADVPAVLRRVRRLRDEFVRGTLAATEGLGERALSGHARLLAPDRLAVDGRELRARRIVLATGSRPIAPAPWRALGERILTTDTLFEQPDLPARMGVVGLGAIGTELAQALARLGVELTAFDAIDRIGGLTDPAVHAVACELLGRELALHLGEKAELDDDGSGGVRVRAGAVERTVERVLVALGRRPNLEGLGLEELVELDERGVPPVDPCTMQVADLPVFLAGDARAERPLLHEAADDGHIAGINATRPEPARFVRRTPLAIVFADPNLAVVGSRYAELEGREPLVGEVRFERQGRAHASLRDAGILRVYAERDGGRLLGCELCAPAGEHLAHLLALAISRSLTVHDLLRMPFYHPVLEEGLRTALRALARKLPAARESDLAGCEPVGAEALD